MGISIWQLLIILVIVLLVFGAKKLKSLGSDLGGAVKGFKEAVNEGEKEDEVKQDPPAMANQSKENDTTKHSANEEKDKV